MLTDKNKMKAIVTIRARTLSKGCDSPNPKNGPKNQTKADKATETKIVVPILELNTFPIRIRFIRYRP